MHDITPSPSKINIFLFDFFFFLTPKCKVMATMLFLGLFLSSKIEKIPPCYLMQVEAFELKFLLCYLAKYQKLVQIKFFQFGHTPSW
jgi:hypothetical protein